MAEEQNGFVTTGEGSAEAEAVTTELLGHVLLIGLNRPEKYKRFSQLEINRGIYAFGGATARLPRNCGWGNAMRSLLTGQEYDVAEALRIGLVQEVVAPDAQLDRALDTARRISDRSAPLGIDVPRPPRRTSHGEANGPRSRS